MTCAHVLDLIDAGPFAGHPRAYLDAAWQHAHHCPACGPALAMMRDLETALPALNEPTPPPDFTAAVLSRIADVPVARASSHGAATASAWRRWPAWTAALGGTTALVALQTMASTDGAILSPRTGSVSASLIDMPVTPPGVLVLAIGLVLYVTGLFAVAEPRR